MNPKRQLMNTGGTILILEDLNSNSSLHPPIFEVCQSGVDTKGWRNLRISHEQCLPLAPIAAAGLASCVLAMLSLEENCHNGGRANEIY